MFFMKHRIINERNGNPFPRIVELSTILARGFSPVATGGYYHNDAAIMRTIQDLVALIGLREGSRTIDYGTGTNTAVAERLAQLGMKSYTLDAQEGHDPQKHPDIFFNPPKLFRVHNGVRQYCGALEEISSKESELRKEKFDLGIFWGDWEAAGNNFAIGGEWAWFRASQEIKSELGREPNHKEAYGSESLVAQRIRENKRKLLKEALQRTNSGGGLLFVSPRYARHGGGYTTDLLPLEKRGQFHLIGQLENLGAKQFYLFGLSKENLWDALVQHQQFRRTAVEMTNENILCAHKDSKEEPVKPLNINLGRIDAIYAQV